MDKQVPLLTSEQAYWVATLCTLHQHALPNNRMLPALDALASGDAATYNTHTHEVVPKGLREVVEQIVSELRSEKPIPSRSGVADRLQRALNGEKA